MARFARIPTLLAGGSLVVLTASVAPPVAASLDEGDAPQLVARTFTRADGLPSNSVLGVTQTSDGYLWFGTQDGVVRFDGVQMRVFDAGNTPGLTLNLTPNVTTDADGDLVAWGAAPWVAVRREGSFQTFGTEVGLPRTGIYATLLADHELIVPGNLGAHRLTDGRYVLLHPDLEGRAVRDVSRRSDGSLLLAVAGRGLLALSGSDLVPVVGDSIDVRLVAEDRSGTTWFTTPDGVFRVGDGQPERQAVPGVTEAPTFLDVEADDGTVWVGGSFGLARRRPFTNEWERLDDRPCGAMYLAEDGNAWAACGSTVLADGRVAYEAPGPVRDIHTDREGNVWLAVAGTGVVQLSEAVARVRLPELHVTTVERDGDALWLGVSPARLVRIDATGTTAFPIDEWPQSIHRAGDGRLFLGCQDGLFTWSDGERERVLPFEITRRVFSVTSSSAGDLWVAGFGSIGRLRAGEWTHYTIDDGISAGPTRVACEAPNGDMWFATPEGALRWSGASFRLFTEADGLTSKRIRSVYVDARNVAWIATEGRGVNRTTFDDAGEIASVEAITEANGLFENGIYWISEDRAGRMWMTSNRGIAWCSTAQMDELAAGSRMRIHCHVLGEHEGLRSSVTSSTGTPPAAFVDDRLAVATEAGLAIVPLDRTSTPIPHGLLLEQFASAESLRTPVDGMVVSATERTFEISYTLPSFSRPQELQFRYRLDGYQDHWINAGGRRTAYFTSVPAGRYRFLVEAADASGEWNATASLGLLVAAHVWETRWFRAAAVLSFLGLCLGAVYVRFQMARRRERELQRQVHERTRDLAMQTERLEELDRAKSRFFANVSHEFRTPLTLTIGPLEDLLSGMHGTFDEDAKRELRTALDSSRSVLDLVNQILELAKLESGRLQLRPSEVDVPSLLHAIADEFAPLSERRDVALHLGKVSAAFTAQLDEHAIRRVLTNLLSNAFKFTPAGGSVTIGVERDPAAGSFVISVHDTGVGIPAIERKRIFERFHQADGHPRSEPGTGIGLSLARELVELHGGDISVESDVGEGSTFRVRLPVVAAVETTRAESAPIPQTSPVVREASATEPDETAASSTPSGDGDEHSVPVTDRHLKILLAEDHAQVRALLRKHLSPRYHVVEAADGQEALELARKHIPDLVVSDVMMPEMDGIELCTRIKSDPEIGFIPIVMLTARADTEDHVEGFAHGADAYVTKPFEPRVLLAQIDAIIRERRRLRTRYTASAARVMAENLTSADQAYVESVNEVIAEHLADEDFSVEQLAEALGQTRSSLFRRLKEAIGTTPSAYIRTLRLERAKAMLEASTGTVNEIAYGVGFKSVSHFCTAFKAAEGQSPGAWARARAAGTRRADSPGR